MIGAYCLRLLLLVVGSQLSLFFFFFLMIRRPPRSTHCISSAASDVYKRQGINAEYMGTYRDLLTHFKAPWPQAPMNESARLQAGFSQDELAGLAKKRQNNQLNALMHRPQQLRAAPGFEGSCAGFTPLIRSPAWQGEEAVSTKTSQATEQEKSCKLNKVETHYKNVKNRIKKDDPIQTRKMSKAYSAKQEKANINSQKKKFQETKKKKKKKKKKKNKSIKKKTSHPTKKKLRNKRQDKKHKRKKQHKYGQTRRQQNTMQDQGRTT
eukprot:TRINITY_DN980_c0_g1_i2.p1 TRINITY_DN980_c0_g1~~TRINITY_DN980_c0_g1_i2.p1  ORF type:complete len:266 (-),score=53.25 TRINITY_DN980_c0_g1_i2:2-799(-)